MSLKPQSKLNPKKKYLQVALNSTLADAQKIISILPVSDRIIVEAGTPLIKRYGADGIKKIKLWCQQKALMGGVPFSQKPAKPKNNWASLAAAFYEMAQAAQVAQVQQQSQQGGEELQEAMMSQIISKTPNNNLAYVVADLKTMDRAEAEVQMVAAAGADAAVALGIAPIETLNSFVAECEKAGIDAMIDMMNVEFPLSVLRQLKKVPPVVILHRGVDEEKFNRQKMIPLHEIRRIKGNYNIMIAIAGGDTLREVQSSIFNDADIVVVWKQVFQKTTETKEIINGFLKQIK
jgi:3-keto-L-gulonate-6-phosphate decarboxylase